MQAITPDDRRVNESRLASPIKPRAAEWDRSPEVVAGARPRVLCVEDELGRIEGLLGHLKHRYDVTVADTGPEAIRVLTSNGPFPVVVSDMRTPEIEGSRFIKRVQRVAPDSSQVLLVGPADLENAMRAVSSGEVFRALRKPFSAEAVGGLSMSWRVDVSGNRSFLAKFEKALGTATRQYRLVTADKELLAAELEKHKNQLLQAERLATLGTLAGGVGHELNNIAQVLFGVLPFVRERAGEGLPPKDEDLRELDRVAEHLRSHAFHLLNLGRPGKVDDGELNLVEIIESTLAMLSTAGRTKAVQIVTEFPAEPVPVQMDQTRLEQVLVNLIGNASDALSEINDDRTPQIRIVVKQPVPADDVVTCTIEDNGCGISSEQREQIFEPYFTTKPPDRGTGLGLPVVKQIIETYGGHIELTSEENQGTAFVFDLPRVSTPD